MMRGGWYTVLLICLCWSTARGQGLDWNGLYGQTGVAITPVATVQTDRRLTGGWQYIPARQAHLEYSRDHGVGENAYFLRLGFLPWAEVSLRLVHPERAGADYGIGDRSIFAKVQVLRETDQRPALAIGIHDPFGTQLLPASYLVTGKGFHLWKQQMINLQAGYGFRLYGEQDYLIEGFFGSVRLLPDRPATGWWPQWMAGVEFHRQQINLTAGITLFRYFQVQGYLLDGRDFGVGVSGQVDL